MWHHQILRLGGMYVKYLSLLRFDFFLFELLRPLLLPTLGWAIGAFAFSRRLITEELRLICSASNLSFSTSAYQSLETEKKNNKLISNITNRDDISILYSGIIITKVTSDLSLGTGLQDSLFVGLKFDTGWDFGFSCTELHSLKSSLTLCLEQSI